MSVESFYPFDNNAVTTELQWSRMMRILMPDGVDALPAQPALQVTKTGNLTCNVAVGSAWIRGFYYSLTGAAKQISFAVNTATSARIDYAVLRVDWNANTITPFVIQGTPAAEPVPPALTKSEASGIFDLPLAEVRVEANDVIATVTDRRRFIGRPMVWCTSGNRPHPEGRPLLAFEMDTSRVIFNAGSGAWNVGLGNDIYRPHYIYSGDNGSTSSTNWDTTLDDTVTPSLSLAFIAPPSGRAMIHVGAFLSNSISATTFMALRLTAADGTHYWAIRNTVGTTSAFGADRMIFQHGVLNSGTSGASCAATWYAPTLTPNTRYTATLCYAVRGGKATIDDRFIKIDPLP